MFQRISLLLLSVGLLALTACEPAESPKTDAGLVGTWKSSYGDGFQIAGSTYTQYDNAEKAVSFVGIIQGDPDLTDESGALTLKITNAGTWGKTVDRYYVVRWKGLTEKGVKQSSASLYPKATPEPTTQAEAETTFTEAAGAFASYGDYARQ